MMDHATIQDLAKQAAQEAEENGLEPLFIDADLKVKLEDNTFTDDECLPFLGDYVPPGWKLTDKTYFCDTSGMGQPGERALTMEEFAKELGADYGYAITEAGQFQCYVAQYESVVV